MKIYQLTRCDMDAGVELQKHGVWYYMQQWHDKDFCRVLNMAISDGCFPPELVACPETDAAVVYDSKNECEWTLKIIEVDD